MIFKSRFPKLAAFLGRFTSKKKQRLLKNPVGSAFSSQMRDVVFELSRKMDSFSDAERRFFDAAMSGLHGIALEERLAYSHILVTLIESKKSYSAEEKAFFDKMASTTVERDGLSNILYLVEIDRLILKARKKGRKLNPENVWVEDTPQM